MELTARISALVVLVFLSRFSAGGGGESFAASRSGLAGSAFGGSALAGSAPRRLDLRRLRLGGLGARGLRRGRRDRSSMLALVLLLLLLLAATRVRVALRARRRHRGRRGRLRRGLGLRRRSGDLLLLGLFGLLGLSGVRGLRRGARLDGHRLLLGLVRVGRRSGRRRLVLRPRLRLVLARAGLGRLHDGLVDRRDANVVVDRHLRRGQRAFRLGGELDDVVRRLLLELERFGLRLPLGLRPHLAPAPALLRHAVLVL
ncbi:MAG: hypothetical protein M5U28_00315 [Sandaracinaceae bacterium]|nr:hypothetical protein [Sandaracinaceae bacterium]